MSTERKEYDLNEEDTTRENEQSKSLEESSGSSSSSSSSDSSSSEGDDDPAYVPLAQSFSSSESSQEEEEGQDGEGNNETKKKKQAGRGLFLRGFETERSLARKRRRFGSMKKLPKEPAHVRRQKREYYDSDNSYEGLEAPGYDKFKANTLDCYEIAAHPSCDKPIFKKFPEGEVSELIGYATDSKAQASISAAARRANLPPILMNDQTESFFPDAARQSLVSRAVSMADTSNALNPLLGLTSTPLPTSHLRFISKLASQSPNFKSKLENRFGDSALVATGMLVEEMITASLMPLAGYHVMRCRELEARREKVEANSNSDKVDQAMDRRPIVHPITGKVMQADELLIDPLEKPSEEWTLPPDEAMMKLLEQDAIPSEGLRLVPPASQTLGDPNRKISDKYQNSMQLWTKDNKVDRKQVVENMDIYRIFLPMKNYKDTIVHPALPATNRTGRPRHQNESLHIDSDIDLESSEESED